MFYVCFLYFPSFTVCFELCSLLSSVFYMKSKQTKTSVVGRNGKHRARCAWDY